MNDAAMRRMMMRDQARNNRDRASAQGRDSNRGYDQRDYRGAPRMSSRAYMTSKPMSDYNSRNRFTPRGFDSRDRADYRRDYAMSMDYARNGDMAMQDSRYDGHYPVYPFEIAGRVGREYPMYDHSGSNEAYLSEQELKQWAERLLEDVDDKDKIMLEKEAVLHIAESLGIEFKEFTKEEFYVTVLMMYTDFCKTLGTANFDVYLKLAKDWLCDEDIAVKYSEKLATYYDMIVEGM